MKPLWNSIFGGVVGASVTAFVAVLALSMVATNLAFGLFALWLFPCSALIGLSLGVGLQGFVYWEQPCPRSLRHWFVAGAAAAIFLFLAYFIVSLVRGDYTLSDMENKLFSVIVIPLILCSFAGVIGGSVGLTIGAIVHRVRRKD